MLEARKINFKLNIQSLGDLSKQGVTYGVRFTLSESPERDTKDQLFSVNVQVPFDKLLPRHWISYSLNTIKSGSITQQVGLSGTALTDNNLNYNIEQRYANEGAGASGNVSANYRDTYGEARARYTYTSDSQQVSYGLQGGIAIHPYGVTFSQQQGETIALIRAPGGLQTYWRGYTVAPYVSTYRKNRIALDTGTLGGEVEVEFASQPVCNSNPWRGSSCQLQYPSR